MSLLGLGLAQLAAIFGALGGAVTLLYVLKLRRRRVQVPFARLWERVIEERESTSLFRRLKRLLSLLLQLCFLLLLTGALGDPRLSAEVLEGRQIILLIDTSASMKATDGEDGTRIETALRRARQLVRGLSGADVAMVVRMDAQVTPLSPFTGDEKALLKVLDNVEASDTPAALARALEFCADALRERKNPLLVLIGDGAYDPQLLRTVVLDDRSGTADRVDRQPAGNAADRRSATSAPAAGARSEPAASAIAPLDRIDLRGIAMRFIPVGSARRNVGIVAFNARRYPSNKLSFEVFLEVVYHDGDEETADRGTGDDHPPGAADGGAAAASSRGKPANGKPAQQRQPGQQEVQVDLQLLADGVITEVQRLALRPGERARFSCGPEERQAKKRWCEMAASGSLLEARLVPAGSTGKEDPGGALDAFPLDDRAYALLPKRRKQKVLLVSAGNLFLEGAMLLDENIEHRRIAPAAYSKAALAGFDAVVLDGFYPDEAPPLDTLLLAPPPDPGTPGKFLGPFEVRGMVKAPVITEQNDSHPLMRWVTLKDVNISASAAFARRAGDVSLASSFRTPLIIARSAGGLRQVAIGFDPRRSDLPLRVAFPILIINTFHWFSGESEELVTTYKTGETWRVPLAQLGDRQLLSAAQLTVIDPAGRALAAPVHDGRAVIHGTRVGVYQLHLGGEHRLRLAANLADSDESNIRPRRSLVLDGRTLSAPTGFGVALRREIWVYLLLAALGLSLVEWLTYNRRITV